MTEAFPMKVFGARAIVKLDKDENESVGGIIIPNKKEEPVNKGVIMAVGEGARLETGQTFPMEVGVGDIVVFAPMAGAPIELPDDESKYLVINERDVLAVVE